MADGFFDECDVLFGPSNNGSKVARTSSSEQSYTQNPDGTITSEIIYTPEIAESAKNVVGLLRDFRSSLLAWRNSKVPADDSIIIGICEGCINLFNQAAELNRVLIGQKLFTGNNIPDLAERDTTREMIAYNPDFSPSLFNNNTIGLILSALLTATATENESEFARRATEREEVGQLPYHNTPISQEADPQDIEKIRTLFSSFLDYLEQDPEYKYLVKLVSPESN